MKSSLLKAKTTSELSISTITKRPRNVQAKRDYKSYRNKKIISGRTCRVCGKDPYPNYFFCPTCHHRVGKHEENE